MSDESQHRLLPRFILGELDEDEVARFREHLHGCEECRSEKAFLETLQSHVERRGGGFLEGHPPVDRLVAYVSRELADDDSAVVREHLGLCATCASEVRWISGEAVAGRSEGPEDARALGSRPWLWVAVAAVIVLALLVPRPFDRRDRPHAGDLFPQLIAQVERSEGRRNVVRLPADGSELDLFFVVDLPTSEFPCKAEIVRDDGKIVYSKTAASRDDLNGGLYVYLHCPQTECRPGEYTVRIEGSGGSAPEIIPFRVSEPVKATD